MLGFLALSLKQRFGSLLCVWFLFCAHPALVAQESGTKSAESKPPESNGQRKGAAEGQLPPPSVQYLPTGDKHELVPVPGDADLESYNKFLEEKRNKAQGPLPYTISEVDIDGTANDERATLTVTFTVRLQHDRYERVPLYFNDAVLLPGFTYSGDGEQVMDTKDPKQGFVWWFKGKGPHRLKLVFSLPLQKPIPSRHLIVPLPVSAVSHIKMTLPFSSVKPTVLPEKAVVTVTPSGNGKTVIEAIGLGAHLDLSWQPNIDIRPNEVSLESQTTIHAQINSDHVTLRANQKVNSLYGQFDHVTISLPTDGELISLEGPEKESIEIDPEKRQQVKINFREKISSAQLHWIVRLPAKLRSPVTIDGFVVEESHKMVVKHVGWIGLSLTPGLQFSERRGLSMPSFNQNLSGTHVGDFAATAATGTVDRAYKISSQPFKLVTAFDEVKPSFEVRPQLLLSATAQQISLDGKFEYRVVDRYGMNEVVLTWPNHKSEGWTIDSVEEPKVVESYSEDKGQITVRLIKSFSNSFVIHVRAHRNLKPSEEVAISMPRPRSAARLSPTTLILVNAENVETDLTGRNETVFRQLPSSTLDQKQIPESMSELKTTIYRVDTDDQSFGLRVIPQKQRLRTESLIETKWQNNRFEIEQRVYYNVDYERLSQIRLTVPPSIAVENCSFFDDSHQGEKNHELKTELLPKSELTPQLIQLKLQEQKLGKFEVRIKYSIPFLKDPTFDTETFVELPFFGSADEPFSQTRVSLTQSDWFDAEPVSTDVWRPQRNRSNAWEWVTDGTRTDISLKMIRSARRGNETGNVSLGLIKVELEENGTAMVRTQFRMSTRTMPLPLQLPANAKAAKFFWDDRELPKKECVESPAGTNRYLIEPEQADLTTAVEHLLTVTYHEAVSPSLGWSVQLTLGAPVLSNCSWDKVLWQVVLPTGQHLLTYPTSAASLFHWQRTGLVWSRVSDCDSDCLQKRIMAGAMRGPALDDDLLQKNGNPYLFRQLDSPKPLVFHTLSSSMALLLGAGFSLLVGFVMLRVAALQNVLTLLLMAVLAAIAGLWYSAPMELLLQPMIAGLLLPVAAVMLERWIRKRYDHGILAFEQQGEFPPLQAFGNSHFGVRQADPNEATLHRPPVRDSDPGVPLETGSGVS